MQNDTIRANELYASLRTALGPVAKAAGFKRSKIAPLAWARPAPAGFLTFWFQCDRYGWMHELGSRFTLEFQRGDDPDQLHNLLAQRARFGDLLTPEDREKVRLLNNNVFESLPPMSADHPLLAVRDDLREALLAQYRPRAEPYAANEDPWLHYYRHAHLPMWAGFLEQRILALCDRFMERQC